MSSFPIAQVASTTGATSVTFGSNSVAGNIILLFAGVGINGGNPTLPTSVTDSNANSYIQLTRADQEASSGKCSIWVAYDIKITPNNPITVSMSGTTYDPLGPSMIIVEIGPPPADFQVFATPCGGWGSGSTDYLQLIDGAIAGVTTGVTTISLTLGASGNGQNFICALFLNGFKDATAFFGDYTYQTSTPTWTSTGTILATTVEAVGAPYDKSLVAAYQILSLASGCGTASGGGLAVQCNNPPSGVVGTAYSHTFTASGGYPPYTFSFGTGLPPGITQVGTSGVVSGTPTMAGTYSFTVTVTDSVGNTASVSCTIVIASSGGGGSSNMFY